MTAHFRQMARNNAWANATLYEAVLALPQDALRADYPSFFGTLPALLNHIHEVDLYYLDALREGGQGRKVYDREEVADMAELAARQAAVDAELVAFCDGLSEGELSATRVTERREGVVSETVGALLLHLFQHQVHHRGQAHGMLSQAGTEPPQLDEFFLEYGRAPSARRYWEDTGDV